ncbi:MAG: tetratricopeptide (TPR) repeat protein [Bacillariaceae sp.]
MYHIHIHILLSFEKESEIIARDKDNNNQSLRTLGLATTNINMLPTPIDTSYALDEDGEIGESSKSQDQRTSAVSVSSNIELKSPKYGMHPPQHPTTDKPYHQQQQQQQQIHNQQQQHHQRQLPHHLRVTSSTSATASVTSQSQEYSNHSHHNSSSHSKNSSTSTNTGGYGGSVSAVSIHSSSIGGGNNNSIVVSSFSNLATQSIGQGKYRKALEYYQLALQDYLKEGADVNKVTPTTVVELVNAAATCFNLGALAKKLHEYPQAAEYFSQAQQMYKQSGNLVEQYVRTLPNNSNNTAAEVVGGVSLSSSSSSISTSSCQVCLLQLIVETLQARAHLHYKYQDLIDDSIECHEQAIEILQDTQYDTYTNYYRIQFTVLSQQARWHLLITSLQALGKFYVEKGEIEDAIVAYQDTLSIITKLNDFSSQQQRQDEITQILRALSDIYMQTNLESTDILKLERSAILQEDINNWEKAMQCWERVLYCQSKEYGEESLEVSIALAQLARVMVLEGNLEGALDLYHATAKISLKNQSNKKNKNIIDSPTTATTEEEVSVMFSIPEDVFCNILDLYNELDQIPDAIGWLKSLLSKSERREDQARIQLELGKLYLDQGFFHAASDSLYLSLELFDGEDDESAFELLKKVELLQNNNNQVSTTSCTGKGEEEEEEEQAIDTATDTTVNDDEDDDVCRTSLTAITEEGESAFASAITASLNDDVDDFLDDDHNMITTTHDNSEDLIDSAHDNSNVMNGNCVDPISRVMAEEKKEEEEIPHLNPRKEANGELTKEEDQTVSLEERKLPSRVENELLPREDSKSSIDSSPRNKPSNTQPPIDKNELYSTDIPDFISDNNSCPDDKSESVVGSVHKEQKDNETQNSSESDHQPSGSNLMSTADADKDEEVLLLQRNISISCEINITPTTLISATSRTALLNPTRKSSVAPASLNIPNISSSSPKRQNQKTSRGRKGYTEMKIPEKQPGTSGKSRFVKALASPFRRSRSKSRSTSGHALVPLDEEKEVRQSMPVKKAEKTVAIDNESFNSNDEPAAPVSYINMKTASDDELSLVSQLTFRQEEMLSRKKEANGHHSWWGLGVTTEGLEGWFPSSYVNQAVDVVEGFLSANVIHDRVKSRPIDFESDEDSEGVEEDFSLLKDQSSSKQTKTQVASDAADKNLPIKSADLSSQSRKTSVESSAVKDTAESSNSGSSKIQPLESQIEEKELALEVAKIENGPEDTSVAAVLFDLASLYTKKKDFADAMLYCRQALKIQKSTLNLPLACDSLCFMAEIHCRERRYKEALSCYSEAQRIREAFHGTYFHEEIANTLNLSGNVLARQGEFDLAMDKHKEALRILKECCGENVKNPLVSQTLIHIGGVYYKERNSLANIQCKRNDGYSTFIEGGMLEFIGRAHEDRGSYRMAIAFYEEKLQFLIAAENSEILEDVAETLNSLGMLSCRAGMYLEAIDYYDRALGIQMKLGCDDVQLAMARVLAGSVQYSLGHFNKALKLFQDALGTLREVGLEQETVAATLFYIGIVHAALCNYDDAMSNLCDAFDIQKKLLGIEHPATFRTRREIGNLYSVYDAELDAAFVEYNDIIEAQKRVHGEKHPYVAETLHCIGCAQARKGDLSGALQSLEECYNMRLQFLGMDHPQQATTLHEIAKIQLKRGRLKKAIHIIDAALNIRVESLSEHHIDVALAMTTKASCLVAKGNFADANKLFIEALPIAKSAVGDLHPSVAWIQVQIGVMHLRKCDLEEAADTVNEAIAIYKHSNLDADHPGIKEATVELEKIERAEMLCV